MDGLNITAVSIETVGRRPQLTPEQAVKAFRSRLGKVWIHIVAHEHDAAVALLQAGMGLHELAVEDALSCNERPALSEYDNYIFLTAPAVHELDHEEKFVEVAFFMTRHALVTVATEECPVINSWMEKWDKRALHKSTSTADVLHMLVDAIVDGYIPVIDEIEDEVDTIADNIFAGNKNKVYDLLAVKRRLLNLRRRVTPLREVVNSLLRRDITLIPDATRPYFQDVYDHASRLSESIDLQRDTLTSLLDVHLSVVSNNLNEVMKKMTVIATVLMTAALIAGIYGMNFKNMPELNWWFGYPFALGLMVVSSLGILWLFKLKRWI